MVTVDPFCVYPIETTEFIELSLNNVFEGAHEPRMKHNLSETVLPEVPGKLLLSLHERCWTRGRRKRCRKVEV
jgi:hypothetical protein